MKPFGTPHSDHALRVLLLGAGELGKEVAIELQRYAVEVIAVDRYANAPAMQIAHRSHVIDMLDGKALRAVIELEKPDLVVPEIEAIHTATLIELEKEGQRVVPTARATWPVGSMVTSSTTSPWVPCGSRERSGFGLGEKVVKAIRMSSVPKASFAPALLSPAVGVETAAAGAGLGGVTGGNERFDSFAAGGVFRFGCGVGVDAAPPGK